MSLDVPTNGHVRGRSIEGGARSRVVADAFVVGAVAAASLWRLFEMDVFWAIRAGRDFVATGTVPMTEEWSYTVPGTAWLNTHWLTEVVCYGAYATGGYACLVVLRSFLVAAWLAISLALVRTTAPASHSLSGYGLIVLGFVASTYRMELRGELFVLLAFTSVLWLWARTRPRRETWTALLVLASANFHAGQAVMVLALGLGFIAWEHRRAPARMLGWTTVTSVAFLVTPVHVRVFDFIRNHLFYRSALWNPDHQPLRAGLFDPVGSGHGLAYWAWAGLGAGALVGLWRASRTKRVDAVPYLVLWCGTTWLCVDRVRAVPFAVAVYLPLVAVALSKLALPARFARIAIAIALLVLPVHLPLVKRRYGLGVDDTIFPVRAAEFIERTQPARNLYHTFTFGAFLVWALQDYRLFGDTRETPFRGLTELYLAAYHSPQIARALHDRFDINTLLVPVPGTERIQNIGWRDILEEYTPRSEWALVYFDDVSLVMTRRVPGNAELIRAHEYTLLRPNLPPELYPRSPWRTPESDKVFEAEIARCLEKSPVRYCEAARDSFTAHRPSG